MMSHRVVTMLPIAAVFLGSAIVLMLADVGRTAWIVQLAAVALACIVALAGSRIPVPLSTRSWAVSIAVMALLGIAATLVRQGSGPQRWWHLGPIALYAAPIVMPAFLGAVAILLRDRGRARIVGVAAAIVAGGLFVLQPDASQALALCIGVAIVAWVERIGLRIGAPLVIALAALTAWAFTLPDPLQPVPHVEGVLALALAHSLVAGLAVMLCAAAFVAGLAWTSRRGPRWLLAVAGYYAVLFACSVAGLTPAPMVGYGAAPWLGFGLLVVASRVFDSDATR
ncbi:FtsW/RodA/SpoVE family cell cycle protein [Dokdonella sp. MW10]|uniref:FtsW/RodA/SpoVE family cell cycle protein n=1 Tax=Dokdonella sp. MW10 TaxID=2992926 RepID=UPI003F7DF92B